MAVLPVQSNSTSAWSDWWRGTGDVPFWWTLARKDILDRYRRSLLGPIWLTISTSIAFMGMGPLYATLFNVPFNKFFPHLALGVIFWTFISGTINDSCLCFVSAAPYLKYRPYPLSVFIWRTLARNVIQLLHQLPVFLPIAYLTGIMPSWQQLLVLPGLLLLFVILHAVAFIAAITCARFRDVPQLVAAILQMVVFMTPVLWLPESLPKRAQALVNYNPFAQMIDVVRLPLLGQCPTPKTYLVLLVSATVSCGVAAFLFSVCRRRLIYWL
jgi:lipopolysaccharide transport system permease protein